MAQKTDSPGLQADALSELAAVLQIAGELSDAQQAIDEAISLYRAKGDRASVQRASLQAARMSAQ
jgi:hypothetical protein